MKKLMLIALSVLTAHSALAMHHLKEDFNARLRICPDLICTAISAADGEQREVLMAQAHNKCIEVIRFKDPLIHLRCALEDAENNKLPQVIKDRLRKEIFKHEYPLGSWERFKQEGKKELITNGVLCGVTAGVILVGGVAYRMYGGSRS